MDSKDYILVVEDEDSIRIPLKDYFTRVGLPVLVASDGVGAIKHILDFNVKVVVSDYRMDVLGGDYWVRFLQRFCPAMRVVFTSGFLESNEELAYEVLPKPYSFKDLELKVRVLFEK